jgi:hypothetical protein
MAEVYIRRQVNEILSTLYALNINLVEVKLTEFYKRR